MKLEMPMFHSDVAKYAFATRIVKVWNNLPVRVISAINLISFRQELDITRVEEKFNLESFLIGNKLK